MPKLYQDTRAEPEAYVHVRQEGSGAIAASIVSPYGDRMPAGNLFGIRPDGCLEIHGSVDPSAARKAGIALDVEGRIELRYS